MGLTNLFRKKEKKEECNCACNCEVDSKEEKCCTDSASVEIVVNKENEKGTDKEEVCNCGSSCGCKNENIIIKVLGSGCKKCLELEKIVNEVVSENSIKATVIHVNDFSEISKYGVMSTPALVIDEKVVSYGKLLTKEEVLNLIAKHE